MRAQILSIAIVAGFVLIAADASAQRGPDFGTLDANGDGSLTMEEMQSAGQARFEAADMDGNGALTVEELTANDATQRAERILARFDDNKDGMLTIDEMGGARPERAERMFERVDQDEDGVISEAEFAEMSERRGGGRGRK